MKRVLTFLLLASMLVCAISCSDDAGIVNTSADSQPVAEIGDRGGIDLDTLEYETFTGILQPGDSAILYGVASTWPGTCTFALNIPASATAPGGDPITFTMRVPTYASYMQCEAEGDTLPLILRMGPDDMQFNDDVTVMATWMPWRDLPERPFSLYYWYLLPDGTDSDYFQDFTLQYLNKNWQIHFSVDHFSDWESGGQLTPPF